MTRKNLFAKQVHLYSICSLIQVEKILYLCGKDMIQKNDLHHKQVNGTAGAYQVEDVKNAMMLNIGGSATTNYVFIIGEN